MLNSEKVAKRIKMAEYEGADAFEMEHLRHQHLLALYRETFKGHHADEAHEIREALAIWETN